MNTLSTYASGYPVYYQRDRSAGCPYRSRGGCNEHEINALEHGGRPTHDPENPDQSWWPRTEDFLAEAIKRAGRPIGVPNMAALLRVIGQHRSIDKVLWFGHGASGELQFGSGQRLNSAGIASLADVSGNFARGGAIEFYACNAGQSPGFFQSLANRLRVTVRGFSIGVEWNLSWDGDSPHRLITSRGIAGQLPIPNITCTPR
jgi:hypothetical protein